MATITYLYDTYEDASQVVGDLEAAGIPHSDISLVAGNHDNRYATSPAVSGEPGLAGATEPGLAGGGGMGVLPGAMDAGTTGYTDRTATDPVVDDETTTGAGTGASIGTILGGGAGLLAGIGALAIPGVGPVVAAGWLIATLTGAGVGAAAGGVVGSLTGAGVPEGDAHVYAEGVRRGSTLVTVRADDVRSEEVRTIMTRHGGHVDTNSRGEEYRSAGWSRFDENAPAYTGTTGTGTRPL